MSAVYHPSQLTIHSYIEARQLNVPTASLARIYGGNAIRMLERLYRRYKREARKCQ